MKSFLEVFNRIFSYDRFTHVHALALFQYFVFYTLPDRGALRAVLKYMTLHVTGKMRKMIERWSFLPRVAERLERVETIERLYKNSKIFRVHKSWQRVIRESVFLCLVDVELFMH